MNTKTTNNNPLSINHLQLIIHHFSLSFENKIGNNKKDSTFV